MRAGDTLKAWARRIKRDGVTLWFAGRHPRTPWHAKALGLFVVAYALSPVDLIPDFIPVLGYLDDVLLLPGLIWLAVRLLPPDVLAECRAQAEAFVIMGNLSAAINQLQMGLRSGDGDYYQLSSAEARLRELRALEAENKRSSQR